TTATEASATATGPARDATSTATATRTTAPAASVSDGVPAGGGRPRRPPRRRGDNARSARVNLGRREPAARPGGHDQPAGGAEGRLVRPALAARADDRGGAGALVLRDRRTGAERRDRHDLQVELADAGRV